MVAIKRSMNLVLPCHGWSLHTSVRLLVDTHGSEEGDFDRLPVFWLVLVGAYLEKYELNNTGKVLQVKIFKVRT